jgi:hypothetical protein
MTKRIRGNKGYWKPLQDIIWRQCWIYLFLGFRTVGVNSGVLYSDHGRCFTGYWDSWSNSSSCLWHSSSGAIITILPSVDAVTHGSCSQIILFILRNNNFMASMKLHHLWSLIAGMEEPWANDNNSCSLLWSGFWSLNICDVMDKVRHCWMVCGDSWELEAQRPTWWKMLQGRMDILFFLSKEI